ncbi:hypothetical protein U9M48_033908 [Paspalum notatum var. saurae]|uniref:BTB domain-containing protein n=1 Tax=Paspalum notatum var. saurae TaxID=547442 RepID=A0AAQ3X741_PASNO
MGVGEYVSSGTFSVGGCDWMISLYLTAKRAWKAHMLTTTTIKSGHRGTKKVKKKKTDTVSRKGFLTFDEGAGMTWGCADFIDRSKLRGLVQRCGSRGYFTIRCVLTVIRLCTENAEAILVPPSTLHQDFAGMLRDADGADVTIRVGDRAFPAHKYVLAARSKVFKAQLFGAMKDSSEDCIEIHDVEPSVFQRLLHFVYTDSLSESYEGERSAAMQHLLVAADRYGLSRLSAMCEAKLRSWIDVRSVATILGLADQHQRPQLKDACLGFIASGNVLGAVMKTDGFKDLIESYPLIMKDILAKIAAFNLNTD